MPENEDQMLERMEKNGKYDMETIAAMGKSTLWLLWRVYECWAILFYDRLKGFFPSDLSSLSIFLRKTTFFSALVGTLKESKAGYEIKEQIEAREFYVQYVQDHIHPHLPHFRRVHPIETGFFFLWH